MNITGGNPQLFKCGKKGYMNQTYPPLTIYQCGMNEGKLVAKDEKELYSIMYQKFLTYEPEGAVIKCGDEGFLNTTDPWPRDYYACGLFEGKDTATNAGVSSSKSSRSLVKVIIFFMLVVYALE